MAKTFPPAGHSGTVDDDVAYARLVDNSGSGAALWESAAMAAGTVLSGLASGITTDEGAYIDSFTISLTDAQVSGATMPLRLEVYLYDAPVAAGFPALDPSADAGLYSYYNLNGEGNRQWYSLINIQAHEVKSSNLFATLPF